MKQETIERLRREVGYMQSRRERQAAHQPPVAFFEEDARDILAVLEAALDYKAAEEASLALYAGTEPLPMLEERINANRTANRAHAALLALIDLGGTE